MASNETRPGFPSQRTLAAIVFTDVVGFSARMHADEVATLALLQRDFAEMRRLCLDHEGTVLKTTGDGLLLTFTSAVQAVACALAMQRQFAAEAKDPGAANALQHRIGIHLGDILVQDQDVMGDGVNIASRLQSEAEPGGICISQTVYDVVKNKLQMQAVSLGARDLKNIAQAVPVYRLLLEAQALPPDEKMPPVQPPPAPPPASRGVRRGLVIAAALGTLVAVFFVLRAGYKRRLAAGAAPLELAPAAAVPGPIPAPTPAPVAVAAPAAPAAPPQTLQEIRAFYLKKYDFTGMVMALRDRGESATAPLAWRQNLAAAELMARLQSWLVFNLPHYTKTHPLAVADLSGDATKDVSIYLAPDQRIVFLEPSGPAARDWAEIKPAVMGAIIVSALHEHKETRRGIILGAQTFARFYSLPLMAKALGAPKPAPTPGATP
jgi:class 3 adenylate cyclase